MRVTKIIREYVEKSVMEKYKSRLDAIGQTYEKQKNELNDELKLVREAAEFKAQAILSQYEGYSPTSYRATAGYIFAFNSVSNADIEQQNGNLRRKLQTEAKQKVDDILVSLELGASKTELDEMLRNI